MPLTLHNLIAAIAMTSFLFMMLVLLNFITPL